ncbi:uncharacterized protein SCHCODRAFT_02601356 [Schizophyllum commune H4-8]|uniref:Uncharacterized protein n=1 Tax=Schizophyllum commune (strain H4-8 / FGSC 9210) TaxID=578458 RepID=D8QB83_SCHCM|nr:uncharacterized protein SCHCODRAFT_02601356 [Schizophyllum commune H4-8]KAI5889070.1 hypothetical protein SCHCODRAFT_02601356 [Schizophyllum commune H4-8]
MAIERIQECPVLEQIGLDHPRTRREVRNLLILLIDFVFNRRSEFDVKVAFRASGITERTSSSPAICWSPNRLRCFAHSSDWKTLSSIVLLNLTPKGLINDDGNYILQQDDMYGLLKYIWAGLLLPVSESEYIMRLSLSQETIGLVDAALPPLIGAYVVAQQHCETFRTTTYPSITGIAADVFDYAQIVSGQGTSPYWAYANLIETIKALSFTTSDEEIAALQKTVSNIVSYLTTAASDIEKKLQTAVDNLRAFEQTTMEDKQNIQRYQSAIVELLQTEQGDIQNLQVKLKGYQDQLKTDEAAYEHDLVLACSRPSFSWIPFIGIFAASIVASIYGEKASAMANVIGSIRELIYDTEGEIIDEKGIAANLAAIESDVDSLLATMDPAITTVEKMMGIWQSIGSDLASLQQMATSDAGVANAAVAEILGEKLTERWADLAVAVSKYQQAAAITDAHMVTLEELADQLSGRVII